MRTERLDIRVPRNGDYCEDWQLNGDDGTPLDLTGNSLQLSVRQVAGQGAIIVNAAIDVHAPAQGIFTVRIPGSSFVTIPGESEIVRLAYDLRLTYPDGVKAVPVEGQIILTPGASY